MKQVKIEDLLVGQTYYIHQVKDEQTHAKMSIKYKAVCRDNHSIPGGWYDYTFDNIYIFIIGIYADGTLGISTEEDRWGIYNYYLCENDDDIEFQRLPHEGERFLL